jgi:hypothetical protein
LAGLCRLDLYHATDTERGFDLIYDREGRRLVKRMRESLGPEWERTVEWVPLVSAPFGMYDVLDEALDQEQNG